MPFQDDDEADVVELPSQPSTIERLLRKLFVEDLGLKLLALAITLLVWMAVTGESTPTTIHTPVQLNLLHPESLEISNDPPKTVDVFLTGSRRKLNSLKLLDLIGTVDLRNSYPGERAVRLSPQTVSLEVPQGLKIDSFNPSLISVRLEARIDRDVPVEVRIDGTPAEGFEVYGTHADMDHVKLQGPASRVNRIQSAPTESISVEGRKADFTISNVTIDIGDQKVEVPDSTVAVTVEVGPKRSERVFESVPVRSDKGEVVRPNTATVKLKGPADLLEKLNSSNFSIVLNGHSSPRLVLPSEFQHGISLVSTTPEEFH